MTSQVSHDVPAGVQLPMGALAEVLGISESTVKWRQKHRWPFGNGRKVKAVQGRWPDEHGITRNRTLLSLADAMAFHAREPADEPRYISLCNGKVQYAHTIPVSDEEIRRIGGRDGDDELINMVTICLDYGLKPFTFRARQRGRKPKGWGALAGGRMRTFPRVVQVPIGRLAGRRGTQDFYLRSEADRVFGEQEAGVYLLEDGGRLLNVTAAIRLYNTSGYMIDLLQKAGELPSHHSRCSPNIGSRETVMDEDELREALESRRDVHRKDARLFDDVRHIKTETTCQMVGVAKSVLTERYKAYIEHRIEAGTLWWSEPAIKAFLAERRAEETLAKGKVSKDDIAEQLGIAANTMLGIWLAEILQNARLTGRLVEGADWFQPTVPIHRPDKPRKHRRGQPYLYLPTSVDRVLPPEIAEDPAALRVFLRAGGNPTADPADPQPQADATPEQDGGGKVVTTGRDTDDIRDAMRNFISRHADQRPRNVARLFLEEFAAEFVSNPNWRERKDQITGTFVSSVKTDMKRKPPKRSQC